MPKQTQSIVQCHNSVKASLKPRSVKIQKPMASTISKKNPSPDRSQLCLNTSASTASLSQCEGEAHQLYNYQIDEVAQSQGYSMPAINAANVIQYVSQVVYQAQPYQCQVLIPVENQYVAF